MKIGRQWEERFIIWDEALSGHVYVPVGTFDLKGFTTMERYSFGTAASKTFKDMPVGTRWGKKWEYAWVTSRIKPGKEIPSYAKRLWIHIGAGEEMLVWIDGREVGSIDKKHERVVFSSEKKTVEIMAEVYAGHGPRLENGGVLRRGLESVAEVTSPQCSVHVSTYGYVDEEMMLVYLRYHMLYQLFLKLPEESLRSVRIAEGLQYFTEHTDLEDGSAESRETLIKESAALQKLLECHGGDTTEVFSVIGQSHLDLAWLWPLQETRRKVARTYSNQLALMERYPEYKFLLCEPILLEWMREDYPELFRRVVEKVKTGQMVPEGALYVEGDMNLSGGEAILRQFAYGKRVYKELFDVDSVMAWMPDTFGFPGSLPQIMKGCRVKYFSTQKMARQDPECDPFPYNDFLWEGIDGSRILSHMHKKNNERFSPISLRTRWDEDRVEKENTDGMIFPFGFGDGGGGPTEEMVWMALASKDVEGLPKCRMESPDRYMERLEKRYGKYPLRRNVYFGELYLAWHRGTYTSQARIKQAMRQAEGAVREADMLCALLRLTGKEKGDEALRMEKLWKKLLLQQFHDILPGSSIERVNEEALTALTEVIKEAGTCAENWLTILGGKGAVFNSLSWDRRYRGIELPSCGFVTEEKKTDLPKPRYLAERTVLSDTRKDPETFSPVRVEEYKETGKKKKEKSRKLLITNDFYRIILGENGEIISFTERDGEFDYVAPDSTGLNTFRLYQDVNGCYDAWELSLMYEAAEVEMEKPRIRSVETLGGQVVVTISLKADHFDLDQRIVFRPDSPVVDFQTEVDWRERHRILKVDFPTAVFTKEICQEIPFGYIKRPTHRSRQADKDRYETCQHRYSALSDGEVGIAVLNNSKYGMSAKDSTMALTLLKAPIYPDGHADQGKQTFRYGLCLFRGPFGKSNVARMAMEYNLAPTDLQTAEKPVSAETAVSFFELQGGNTVIDGIKPAFDHQDAIVLRIVEEGGSHAVSTLRVPGIVKKAFLTNMLEEEEGAEELPIENGTIKCTFRPFEIKTIILHR